MNKHLKINVSSVFLMLAFNLSLPCTAVPVLFSLDHLLPASFLISSTISSTLEVKNYHKLWLAGWEEKARNAKEACNRRQERRKTAIKQQVETFRPKEALQVFTG